MNGQGDQAFITQIWPNIELALQWIDSAGDLDGDGFVEYSRRSKGGLIHQGWKDSQDAVFHADGSSAEGPIALCEVQGYVFAAKRRAAQLALALGHTEQASRLLKEADKLRTQFERTLLVQRPLVLCLGLGRVQAALSSQDVKCRPLSLDWYCRAKARHENGQDISAARSFLTDGVSEPSQPLRSASIRWRTTTDRSGRTIMPSSQPVWPPTDSNKAH